MTPAPLVFDLVGTLTPLPSRGMTHMALRECADALEVDANTFIAAWIKTFDVRNSGAWGRTSAAFLERLADENRWVVSQTGIRRAAEARRDFARAALRISKEARDTLPELRAAGHTLALVSVCGPATVEVWADSEVASFFPFRNLSAATGLMKPATEAFVYVCRAAGVLPQEAFFTGDGAGAELEGAARAGLTPVLLVSSASTAAGLAPQRWEGLRVTSLLELSRVVRGRDDAARAKPSASVGRDAV